METAADRSMTHGHEQYNAHPGMFQHPLLEKDWCWPQTRICLHRACNAPSVSFIGRDVSLGWLESPSCQTIECGRGEARSKETQGRRWAEYYSYHVLLLSKGERPRTSLPHEGHHSVAECRMLSGHRAMTASRRFSGQSPGFIRIIRMR